MNSDWIQWILISEFIYLWIHIWIQNPYIWIHILMNSYTHEFIYSFHIWIHIMIIWIHMYMNSYIWIHIWIHINYEFIWFFLYVSWIHIWMLVYQGSRCPWWFCRKPELPLVVHPSITVFKLVHPGTRAQCCLWYYIWFQIFSRILWYLTSFDMTKLWYHSPKNETIISYICDIYHSGYDIT